VACVIYVVLPVVIVPTLMPFIENDLLLKGISLLIAILIGVVVLLIGMILDQTVL
jgi:hypothetical protein